MKKSDALLTNFGEIRDTEYESILQSLIVNVDRVWLNANSLKRCEQGIYRNIMQLHEARIVCLWNYEENCSGDCSIIDKIITFEEHKSSKASLKEYIDCRVREDLKDSSEYTTFKIECSNHFTNMFTAKLCGADSIIQANSTRLDLKSGQEDIIQKYAQYIFNETSIASISGLTVEDIIRLRKYAKAFRETIQKKIDAHMIGGLVPVSIIREDCREIVRQYCDEINSRILDDSTTFGTIKGLTLDIASIWLPFMSYLPIGEKLFDSIFHYKQRNFVMYLTTLKRKTR